MLFLMPFAGMAVGAVIGALTGRMGDVGLSDEFMKEASESVGPNESALFCWSTAGTKSACSQS